MAEDLLRSSWHRTQCRAEPHLLGLSNTGLALDRSLATQELTQPQSYKCDLGAWYQYPSYEGIATGLAGLDALPSCRWQHEPLRWRSELHELDLVGLEANGLGDLEAC